MADKKEGVSASHQLNIQALRDMLNSFSTTEEGRECTPIIEQISKQDQDGWQKWVAIMGTYIRIADPDIRVSDADVDDVLECIDNSWKDLEEWIELAAPPPDPRRLRAKLHGVKGQLDYAETRWDKIIAIDSFIGTIHKAEPLALPALCGIRNATYQAALAALTKYTMDRLADERPTGL